MPEVKPSAKAPPDSEHVGLIGGLGVGAAVIYYRAIAAGCADRGAVPRITIVHANAPTALAHVTAGRIDELADYLAGFVAELRSVGADFFAIPAVTPHVALGLPRPQEIDEIHRIYLELATAGHTSAAGVQALRDIAGAIGRRDRIDAVVLAGTDLNLIFDETSAGFPAFDCAAAHITAILDRATRGF